MQRWPKIYGEGDTEKLRTALANCGINYYRLYYKPIFSDTHKSFRRLKIWNGEPIFNLRQVDQRQLERDLKEAFGDRYIGAYFIKGPPWAGIEKSFCVKLKK